MSKGGKAALAVAAILAMLVLLSYRPFAMALLQVGGYPLSMLPAEEGLNSGVYGWSQGLYGEVYSAKNPPPELSEWEHGYELVNDDPRNYIFGYWHDYWVHAWHGYERTDIRIETGQPWHEHYKPISYWLERENGELVLIRGDVWIYHVDVVFSIVKKEAPGVHVFKDVYVWTAFVTVVWDKAMQDPVVGKKEGSVWGAPISVYVESWQVDEVGAGDHHSIEPSLEGRFITLYSEPSSFGTTIDDLGISSGGDVNATLSSEHVDAPDSRMRSTAYMRFLLEDFGITTYWDSLGSLVGRDYPTVRYKLKVYYLSLGKWTFTKEEAEAWGVRKGEQERHRPWYDVVGMLSDWLGGVWAGVVAWLRNPFNIAGLAIFFWVLVAILVFAVLTFFLGPPRWLTRKR